MCRMTARAAWPSGSHGASHQENEYPGVPAPPAQAVPDRGPAHAVIGHMAGLLRDTRAERLTTGGILAAIMIGFALEAGLSAQVLPPSLAGALMNLAVLCGLLLSWLIAVLVLAWASRPMLSALSELRWVTGAPLDPRPRWLTVPPPGAYADEWTWTRAHLLLAAARLARYRVQVAETWTCITAGCFLVWTVIAIFGR
jgi:hypothetical protein